MSNEQDLSQQGRFIARRLIDVASSLVEAEAAAPDDEKHDHLRAGIALYDSAKRIVETLDQTEVIINRHKGRS